jgi:hypothetical protein
MPRIRDVLHRFRPAGAPGAPSAAGVPVDRAADVAAELAPVFAELIDTERQCAAIRERAEQTAAATRSAAAEHARAIVAVAGGHVPAERAAAAARVRQSADGEFAAATAAAEREADELRRRAQERLPAAVERVVAYLSGLIAAGQPAAPDRQAGRA